MKDKLLIIGASGHGKVAADIAIKMNVWGNIAFIDDDATIKNCLGLEVIGSSNTAIEYIDKADIFVAIGNNATRERFQEKLKALGSNVPVLIHPMSVIGTDVEIGRGTVVMAGAVINSSARVGKGCIINTGATLDHDDVIEDYVHISPGVNLAGNVRIGKGTWIGIGSAICNNISIAGECKIGAGAVVIGDITEAGTYIGVPAKRMDKSR